MLKRRIEPKLYKLGTVELTIDQANYIMSRGYNFLAIFPDGNFKACYTRKHAQKIIVRWNIKNPTRKTCSLYSVVEIMKTENIKEDGFIKKLLKSICGIYSL